MQTAVVRSTAVALLKTAGGKGALHAGHHNAAIFVRQQMSYGYSRRQDCRKCITALIFQVTATLRVTQCYSEFLGVLPALIHNWERKKNMQVLRIYLGVKKS